MIILVNNKEKEIAQNSSVKSLATELELPENGIALAINNQVIPRSQWDTYQLQENDSLVIIKAACGG